MQQETEIDQNDHVEFVTFAAGNQSYCVEITQIREIRRWVSVTALPHVPEDVLGVMNLRGAVIPIYDLAAKFGLGKTHIGERNVVIVASVSNQTFGLLVESVSEILSVSRDNIQSTPDVKSEATRQSIIGIVSVDGDMARVINLKSVVGSNVEIAA